MEPSAAEVVLGLEPVAVAVGAEERRATAIGFRNTVLNLIYHLKYL